jgi:heme exporter protein C
VCAIYGTVAFLDVPLLYLSVKLLPDKHPSKAHLTPEMVNTLLACLVPATMICAGLIASRYRLNRRFRWFSETHAAEIHPRSAVEIQP